jgi:hypothetical protein
LVGVDGSVRIATGYGLDVSEIESLWERGSCLLLPPSKPALGPNQPPVQWVPSYNYPPSCSVEVEERVELWLTFPLGLYGLSSRENLNFLLKKRILEGHAV